MRNLSVTDNLIMVIQRSRRFPIRIANADADSRALRVARERAAAGDRRLAICNRKEESTMKLYAAPPSPRAFKVLALAEHLGLDYELKLVDLRNGDNTRPEFVALNPNKKMPVLEDDGFVLWESNAILQYLASKKPDSGVLPSDARGRAEVNRWQFWELAHWDSACGMILWERLVKALFGLGGPDPAEVEKGEQNFNRFADVLNGSLKGRQFVTGRQLTVADFSIGAWLNYAEVARYPLAPYPEIKRWYATLLELPAWRRSIVPPPM